MKIGLLVSGNLGYVCLEHLFNNHKISAILTDASSQSITEFAKKNNIPLFVGNPRKGRGERFLNNLDINLIISINYLFLIEKDMIRMPELGAYNFHGSLLPKYRGRTPHVWAIINNEKETGVTVHAIDENCDSGDIVMQKKVIIGSDDTGNNILEKFNKLYPVLADDLIEAIHNGKINLIPQDHSKATYFGIRTPDDGQICWDWQKERIRNWVRAQAFPYPGAFCWLDQHKLIINKLRFSDLGFTQQTPNGTIISIDPAFMVKTPNGVVEILDYRIDNEELLKNDKILN